MLRFFVIAVRNLIKNRTRSLILGGAIAAVTTLLVVLLSLVAGIQQTILGGATALMTGHVNVAGFYKISQGSAAPMVTHYRPLEELTRKTVPEAKLIVDRMKAYGKIISDTTSIFVPMWGVDVTREKEVIGRLPAGEGNVMDLAERGRIAIFQSHAKKLNVKVGDTVTVSMPTYRNVYNTKDVRVVAILKDMGMLSSFNVFLHHMDVREIYQISESATGQIMVFLQSAKDTATVEDRLRKAVGVAGHRLMEKESQAYFMKFDRVSGESWTGQKIDITTWEDETSFAKWVIDVFSAVTFVMTVVLMVIIVLGLMNALWISIRERTGEVGTLRAIGLQRRKVMLMFLIESMTLSAVSTCAGLVLGSAICGVINLIDIQITSEAFQMFLMASSLRLAVLPGNLLMTFVLITFFLTIGSLYPAYKASKMKPITAINHIE